MFIIMQYYYFIGRDEGIESIFKRQLIRIKTFGNSMYDINEEKNLSLNFKDIHRTFLREFRYRAYHHSTYAKIKSDTINHFQLPFCCDYKLLGIMKDLKKNTSANHYIKLYQDKIYILKVDVIERNEYRRFNKLCFSKIKRKWLKLSHSRISYKKYKRKCD